jgi:tetratricopeptide (TPR) repeat protein
LELGRNNLDPAIAYFTQSISACPDDYLLVALATLLRGNCHMRKNEKESAIADYHAVLKLPPVDKSHREAVNGLKTLKVKDINENRDLSAGSAKRDSLKSGD